MKTDQESVKSKSKSEVPEATLDERLQRMNDLYETNSYRTGAKPKEEEETKEEETKEK